MTRRRRGDPEALFRPSPEERVRELDCRLVGGELAAADALTGYVLPRLVRHLEPGYPSLRADPDLEACVLEALREHYRDPFWWGGAGTEYLWDYLRVSAEVAAAQLSRRREREPPLAESGKRKAPPGAPVKDAAMAARAAEFFSRQPECLGYWLEAYREAQAVEPAALASELGCPLASLHHLSLCLRPHEDRLPQEAAALAARYGIDAGRLEAIFLHARSLPTSSQS